jgi:hypothetical protein
MLQWKLIGKQTDFHPNRMLEKHLLRLCISLVKIPSHVFDLLNHNDNAYNVTEPSMDFGINEEASKQIDYLIWLINCLLKFSVVTECKSEGNYISLFSSL